MGHNGIARGEESEETPCGLSPHQCQPLQSLLEAPRVNTYPDASVTQPDIQFHPTLNQTHRALALSTLNTLTKIWPLSHEHGESPDSSLFTDQLNLYTRTLYLHISLPIDAIPNVPSGIICT